MNSILLVDDSKTVLLYMTSALQKQGYEVIAVEDGESALEVLTHRTDIQFVLSDLMMPGISGIELCRELKSSAFSRYIFFVLLSSRNDQDSIIKGMDAGADDFVDKKTSVEELQARIRAGFRSLDLHNIVSLKNKQLSESNAVMSRDLEAAEELVSQLLPTSNQLLNTEFAYLHLPSSKIGGDMLGYMRLDEQNIAMYVLDVSGHGISSALLSFSIQQLLSQSEPKDQITMDYVDGSYRVAEPEKVVEKLNSRYARNNKSALFFTISYLVLDTLSGLVRYCTAGHPSFFIVGKNGLEAVGNNNFMVGAFEGVEYLGGSIQLAPGDLVWMFSDGIIEPKKNGECFSQERLSSVVFSGSSLPLQVQISRVIDEVHSWVDGSDFDDDVTLLAAKWND
ncbi:fused response regulator/phosphatase [Vibrio rotiferianus]|uniref:Fused response regulator/phosphatase n=1 Tax=Vibrio rotiferianus TaxID=190895 RepID=A0A7Y3Z6I9_9VIBR|nr:SpoIIE family protein phosphatase [Vibrio rotiferianus]NOH47418.1 fused response regulator/phosphatase [Vibrio rotiferianus]